MFGGGVSVGVCEKLWRDRKMGVVGGGKGWYNGEKMRIFRR